MESEHETVTEPLIDLRHHGAVVIDLGVVVDVRPVDSAVALLHQLHDFGVQVAVFSQTGDAQAVLDTVGLGESFLVGVTDGSPQNVAARLDTPLTAAVIVTADEDVVAAARRAGFALVIAVDRGDDADKLRRRGADVVVRDPGEIDLRAGDRRLSEIPDALTSRHELTALLRVRTPALFLDFDGTLASIVPDPAAAALTDGIDEVLRRLAVVCPIAVISGRDLPDLQTRVGIPGIWYVGSHGLELVGPAGERYENPDVLAATPALDRVARLLEEHLDAVPGVLVEHKRFSIAVHYRAAPDRVDEICATVHEIAGTEDSLRIVGGRNVLEVRPIVAWNEGRALRWVLGHVTHAEGLLPMYIGDDLADEDAFDALAPEGIGIVVRSEESGNRRSAARFAVNDPEQVHELLQRLADLVDRDPASPSRAGGWILYFDGYDPPSEKLREALCTVGNGFFATRGCAPEASAGRWHYPGTYIAGLYNRLHDDRSGTTIVNESLVNAPNWLPMTFRIDGGPWFDVDTVELLDYSQYLNLRRGVLTRRLRCRDEQGRTTTVIERRFVAMHLPHVGALQTTIVAHDWSGTVEIRSALDGAVRNTLVERYRDLASDHLDRVEAAEVTPDSVVLTVQTNQSRIPVAAAARTAVWTDGHRCDCSYRFFDADGSVGHHLTVDVEAGCSITAEKTVTVFTGRDHAVSGPAEAASRLLTGLGRFEEILDGHVLAWEHLWDRVGIDLAGHEEASRIVRFHLLHLLQTVSRNTADLDVGVPARGLHGEAYRGHIFWDELFVFPVLNLREPALTRSLLQYRYRRLPEARRAAAAAGYRGAMYPWQSGSDGREESQQLHLNPDSGRWLPDPSWRQYHIGIAIAYNVWHYYQVTGDVEFLGDFGAEMLVEIARFFASLASYDRARSRYVIRGAMGPDEFHSGYPDAPYAGIDNNAYTNVMAVWVINRAIEALAAIPNHNRAELVDRLHLDAHEMTLWADLGHRMFVPFHDDVISQFEGHGELAELDWDDYRLRYADIRRLDRILEAEGDDVNRYQASKQADVVMLFYLLSSDELRELFDQLGYRLEPETIPRTIDYYLARTSHGSTLSAVVHSWVLLRGHRDRALEYFEQVLASDITDIQGGTTSEGIHLAAMAGSIDLLQRCFTGLEVRGDRLVLGPQWPDSLGALEFPIYYRGRKLWLTVSGRKVDVSAEPGNQQSIEIMCRDRIVTLDPGCTVTLC
ncbi:trehalose-phosphatase [Rhodococcus zopfii]|uniref:trehalose-phosphatase n=1 Tax=Rhodococcus zopfii TaxID=43772 RepID=UPI003527A652